MEQRLIFYSIFATFKESLFMIVICGQQEVY